MKRIILALLALMAIGIVAFGVHRRSEMNAKKNREAAYETKLRSFTEVLKPGMTRKQIEDYFHANNVSYSEECCVAFDRSVIRNSYDDLVKIGQEDVPWYCSENDVYIAFQFADYKTGVPFWQAKDNELDTLKAITVYQQLGGCL
jgi:hypothetical protein